MADARRHDRPGIAGAALAGAVAAAGAQAGGASARRAPMAYGRYLLIAPISLLLIVFFFFPLAVIFVYSFSATDVLTQIDLTWQNYVNVFASAPKRAMYTNSVIYSAATVAICFLLAFPLAYYIAKYMPKLAQAVSIALLVAPLFMSMLIRIFGWRLFLLKYGLLNEFLAYLGLPRVEGLTYWGPMAIFGMVYLYFPFMLFPLYVAISNVPDELLHAARDLGGTSWRVIRRVVLPLAAPGIAIGSALTFALSFGDATSSEVLVGDNVQLVGNMQKFSFGYAQDWMTGSAESVIMMIFLLVVIVPVLKRAEIERLLYGGAKR